MVKLIKTAETCLADLPASPEDTAEIAELFQSVAARPYMKFAVETIYAVTSDRRLLRALK